MLYEIMGQHTTGKQEPPDAVEHTSSFSEPEALTAKVMGQQLPRKRQYVRKKCKILSDERIRLTGGGTPGSIIRMICGWPRRKSR